MKTNSRFLSCPNNFQISQRSKFHCSINTERFPRLRSHPNSSKNLSSKEKIWKSESKMSRSIAQTRKTTLSSNTPTKLQIRTTTRRVKCTTPLFESSSKTVQSVVAMLSPTNASETALPTSTESFNLSSITRTKKNRKTRRSKLRRNASVTKVNKSNHATKKSLSSKWCTRSTSTQTSLKWCSQTTHVNTTRRTLTARFLLSNRPTYINNRSRPIPRATIQPTKSFWAWALTKSTTESTTSTQPMSKQTLIATPTMSITFVISMTTRSFCFKTMKTSFARTLMHSRKHLKHGYWGKLN